ncbi:ABC transporter [Candidatus Thioglobus autotrophicus]|uniref:ABC transporter n=1 Tax=Candidatus Thioglobus autotrophicus TaxID=1705394 RepID=A0A0M4NX96_9GAMM|nr:ABC transporter ATP-binding protein [Candidatus Thioglobus autotrophicus]ALE52906.1 ABC transporter [Candidatus Thioglobus autotrophicus]WPE16963.1 ABC transporter ATP-binding protein [Candidatus Thioglobus autotrophicus]
MLAIHNLSVVYQNNIVLEGFDLSLEQGEIFALLGDSGSGKSSTLRFIAGLDEAANGDVLLDSVQLSRDGIHLVTPENREVGMVFQDYALFPHMTVFKNISFGIHNLASDTQQQRVAELLSMIGLEGIESKYPHQLSGGEQQRVSLARALAPSPKILLMDEPFSSLDKNHRDQLVSQVRHILKKTNTTSILVTHDINEANALADKVGKIQNKRLTIK